MKFNQSIKLTAILFISVQIWFVYVMMSYSYIGAGLKEHNGVWTVVRMDSKSNSGLMIGDTVLQVNGMNTGQFPSIARWRTLEKAESIVVSRNGETFQMDTRSSEKITRIDIQALAGGIFSLFVAMMLFKWVASSRSAQCLSLLFIIIGATFMSLVASIRGDVIGKSIISTCLVLLPIVLLHFFTIFFKEKGGLQLPFRYIRYIYICVLIVPAGYSVVFFDNKAKYYSYLVNYSLVVPFFIVGVLLNLFLLSYIFFKYRKESKDIANIIKLMWTSLIISFAPMVCLSFIPRIVYGHYLIDSFYTSWAVLLFPLSFSYLLASKKLYDIDLVVRRFIFTTLISFVPGGVLTGLIALLLPGEIGAGRLAVVFIISVILLSITLYSFEYITTKLERVIFPRKHQLQESLKMIARNLGNISSFRELKDIILVDIIETMQVFGGAIVLRYPDAEEEVIRGGEFEQSVYDSDKDWIEDPAFTRFEINRNEEYVCYLILTEKKANTQLGFEETQWLKLIISYLSVSLENLHLIRKLTVKLEQLAANLPREEESAEFAWFRKLMFELQEKERVRIATDLHDTTMQDLFFLKRRCTSLLEKYAHPQQAIAQIKGIIEYIDVINMNLRQSCFELHPYLLKEIGLIRTIQKIVDLEASTAPYEIKFHVGNTALIEHCDLDFKRHLFRMVQELINNAKKHAAPRSVRIEFSVRNSRLYLFYEDDGVGFDSNADVLREIGSSRSGMEYMKSRILSLNGHFEIVTSKGNGFRFMADFPLAEGRNAS